jgi:hypothetical protein
LGSEKRLFQAFVRAKNKVLETALKEVKEKGTGPVTGLCSGAKFFFNEVRQ